MDKRKLILAIIIGIIFGIYFYLHPTSFRIYNDVMNFEIWIGNKN